MPPCSARLTGSDPFGAGARQLVPAKRVDIDLLDAVGLGARSQSQISICRVVVHNRLPVLTLTLG